VALHFQGVDIEATTGTFANYRDNKGSSLQPIEEIVSVNLLDATDEHFAQKEVNPKDFLQAARFASILSHDRDIVTRNLEAAYGKLVNVAMRRDDYDQALKMAQQSQDMQMISVVANNGALYFMKQHEFAKSRKFAEYALKRTDLIRDSYHAEAVYYYNKHRYLDAAKAFERVGDTVRVANCYEALFFEEQSKLGKNLTTADIKNHKSTVSNMHSYAKKSGNKKLIEYADSLKKYL
jgi:tetratricopeptide (TPR) repeat protein